MLNLRVSGTLNPVATGNYIRAGVYNLQPYYRREDGVYLIWKSAGNTWNLGTVLGEEPPLWYRSNVSVLGTFSPYEGGPFTPTGNPVAAEVPTVTSSAGTGGSISPLGVTIVTLGADQVFTATPASGYAIGNWTVDGIIVQFGGATLTLNDVIDDHAVSVAFTVLSARHFCTLADVKTRLGLGTGTDFDEIINQIINGITNRFDNYHPRRKLLMTSADVTEFYGLDPGLYRLLIRQYPIISITEIKESSDYDFDDEDALVADTDYRLVNQGLNGIILRINAHWLAGEDNVRVKRRGGYCGAGEAASAGEYALPDELRDAAITQSAFMFKRKDDIGLSSVSVQGGSISKFADLELLPDVKQVLENYKPPSI